MPKISATRCRGHASWATFASSGACSSKSQRPVHMFSSSVAPLAIPVQLFRGKFVKRSLARAVCLDFRS